MESVPFRHGWREMAWEGDGAVMLTRSDGLTPGGTPPGVRQPYQGIIQGKT